MNAIKEIYNNTYAAKTNTNRNELHLVKDECCKEDCITVNGKPMTKHELNEKMAYFYNNGGTIMDM